MSFFQKLRQFFAKLKQGKKDPWQGTYPKDVARPKNPLPLDPDSGMT